MKTMTFHAEGGRVTFPNDKAMDLDTFREWISSDELPEKCTAYYHRGLMGVDMSKEQLFSHTDVKSEFGAVLRTFAKRHDLGIYFTNGILLTNYHALLSCNPDGTFVSHDAFETRRVRAIQGASEGFVELDGSPDMVLEVVSDSSVKKDTQTLVKAYWEAEIPEYWLVDARGEQPIFRILKHGPKGYTDVRKSAGWLKSTVFEASFKLTKTVNRHGHPTYTIEVKR